MHNQGYHCINSFSCHFHHAEVLKKKNFIYLEIYFLLKKKQIGSSENFKVSIYFRAFFCCKIQSSDFHNICLNFFLFEKKKSSYKWVNIFMLQVSVIQIIKEFFVLATSITPAGCSNHHKKFAVNHKPINNGRI